MNALAALAAAAVLATGPFPDPKQIAVTDSLRCDWGAVSKIDPNGTQLILRSQAGSITYELNKDVRVFDVKGQTLALADLRVGDQIRIYFELHGGAMAREIDKI